MPGTRPQSDYPFWAFRWWHGMNMSAWFGLLARNRFAISPRRSLMAVEVSLLSVVNSILGVVEKLVYGRRIARMTIAEPPIFILGHWRTGTTLLHELLALDEHLIAPTSYECFAPAHALLTGPISWLSSFRLPKTRPMDAMAVGWRRPQEDEIALMNGGAGSFLETVAFPNHRPVRAEFIDLAGLSAEELAQWKSARIAFLKRVLLRGQRQAWWRGRRPIPVRRLVLKSPQDTARLSILHEMFPQACFIHLVRNPEDIFGSSILLWKTLGASQACQEPDWRGLPNGAPPLEEFVLATFERLYRTFAEAKATVPAAQFYEMRYENLARDPVGEIERLYAYFAWDGFAELRTKIESLKTLKTYQPNRHQLGEDARAAVAQRWAGYRDRYGYG